MQLLQSWMTLPSSLPAEARSAVAGPRAISALRAQPGHEQPGECLSRWFADERDERPIRAPLAGFGQPRPISTRRKSWPSRSAELIHAERSGLPSLLAWIGSGLGRKSTDDTTVPGALRTGTLCLTAAPPEVSIELARIYSTRGPESTTPAGLPALPIVLDSEDARVRLLSRGEGYSLFLTSTFPSRSRGSPPRTATRSPSKSPASARTSPSPPPERPTRSGSARPRPSSVQTTPAEEKAGGDAGAPGETSTLEQC